MGTNYYLRPLVPEQELVVLKKYGARLPEIHIGKSSAGWTFTFQALNSYEIEDFVESLKTQHPTKLITSEENWREWTILEPDYCIYDEYQRAYSHDQFWDIVESKRGASRNHHIETGKSRWGSDGHLDDKGNSFTFGEFC